MPVGASQQTYTLDEVASLIGLSRPVISALVTAGFVSPGRGPGRAYRFTFQDIVLLRAAQSLRTAQIAPRRIARSLKQLRATLPEQLPLAGLRLAAVGNEVVVRDGGAPWQADTGQLLFDFEPGLGAAPHAPSAVSVLPTRRKPVGDDGGDDGGDGGNAGHGGAPAVAGRSPAHAAHAAAEAAEASRKQAASPPEPAPTDWFQQAVALEPTDPRAAQAAYGRTIELEPARTDAYLNLGVLLGEAGRHAEAAAVYRQGIARCPPEALLHFNLAVALEDMKQPEAAVAEYERSLALDPALADAHFNLARLHDGLGRAKSAIRHYSAYRRMRKGR